MWKPLETPTSEDIWAALLIVLLQGTCTLPLHAMADLEATPPSYDEKRLSDSIEKVSFDNDGKVVEDDTELVKEVEALEERIQLNEATEEEYLVQEAWQVAIKASIFSRLTR